MAALLDAERSALRDLHARLRTAAEWSHAAESRALALDEARRLQSDAARRQTRGMRDRLRAREFDRRLLVVDAKAAAAAAATASEAADLQVLASEHRLADLRLLVDRAAGTERAAVEGLRRRADLPPSAIAFPTVQAFVVDRPGRAQGDPRLEDLVGEPLGDRWALEERGRPWINTRWRVLWDRGGQASSGEVFAVEQLARPRGPRRVWLLGTASDSPMSRLEVEGTLGRQPERNSLVALAELLGDA